MTKELRIGAWPKAKNAAYNPYQKLLYDSIDRIEGVSVLEFSPKALLKVHSYDLIHIHWPDAYLANGRGWKVWLRYFVLRAIFALARLRSIPIVWTAHNLKRDGQRHERLMNSLFWPWFFGAISGVIYMTKASESAAKTISPRLKDIPSAVIPHGHYRPVLSRQDNREPREVLSSDIPKILFFGSVTRYKNVYKILAAFKDLPPGSAELKIRGKMSEVEPEEILASMVEDLPEQYRRHFEFDNRFLSENELEQAVQEADLVVFPYSDVLNSGSAIFALSVGRPILVSDNSLSRELLEYVGSDWIYLIDGELDAGQLERAVQKAKMLCASGTMPDLSALEWDLIGRKTVDLYRKVVG